MFKKNGFRQYSIVAKSVSFEARLREFNLAVRFQAKSLNSSGLFLFFED